MTPEERPTRRALLASVAATGTATLAGCVVCGSSLPTYDDYLRIAIPRIEATEDGFRTRAAVVHRGEENWDWTFDRDRFFATYVDATLRAYAPTGEELLSLSLGDLEPGATVEREFEVGAFPLIFFATAADLEIDDDVDSSCMDHRTGSHVMGYAGRVGADPAEDDPGDGDSSGEDGDKGESSDGDSTDENVPGDDSGDRDSSDDRWIGTADGVDGHWRWGHDSLRRTNEEYLDDAGHSWLVVNERALSGRERFSSGYLVYRTKCLQRQLAAWDDQRNASRDLSLVGNAESWLSRDERFSIVFYERISGSLEIEKWSKPAMGTPDVLRELYESTDWSGGKLSVTKSVSEETWTEVLTALDYRIDSDVVPFLPCDRDHIRCTPGEYRVTRGHCTGGNRRAYYEVSIDDDRPSGVRLEYNPQGIGPRPPQTADEDASTTD